MARQAGVSPPEALAAAKELLPSLLAALRGYGGSRDALLAMLVQHGGVGLAAQVMGIDRVQPERGHALLAELFSGGKSDPEVLPALIVMLVGGYVAALAAGHGAGPDGIEALLAG